MNGINAIVSGLVDSDVKFVTGVPGYPINELMESISFKKEWSLNEKVALEIALGYSVSNNRSAVIVKHVGMNILSDTLISSVTHTIGAGVVIFAGDDPGALKSQNEQDSRYYGLISEVPVFDPYSPQTAYKSVIQGYFISEKFSTPVIIRITHRLLMMNGDFIRKKIHQKPKSFDKNIWSFTMRGKHQRFHRLSFPKIREYSEKSDLNICEKKSKYGVITSGYLSNIISKQDISYLCLGIVNPLPIEKINEFLNRHKRVIVIEETEPVIESQLSKRVLGKLTGHIPYGLVEEKDVINGIKNIEKDFVISEITPQTLKNRGEIRSVCNTCPYIPLYKAIKQLNITVAGDLGCSLRTASPPFSIIDAAYSLGSAIGTASGFSKKGIAIIGDFGFAHSGLCGLVNAVFNKHELVVVILQNNIAAMTGGQKAPDLTELVKACVKDTVIIDMDEDIDIKGLLSEKLNKDGISVIIARGVCPMELTT